jgi:uncharacterized protein YndB with AHSA1/START domain
MPDLPYSLERTVLIRAQRETVFRYFTDSARFASWWGAGSEIEGRVGGRVHVCHPGAVIATGEVVSFDPGRSIAFTYGYEGPGKPIPPGGSRITITLEDAPEGTRLHLLHEVPSEAARNEHLQGWRYQLALFSTVAAAEQHSAAATRVDALFRAWGEPDSAARKALLETAVTPDMSFRDRYSATQGLDDLHAHLAAVVIFMPGVRIAREGDVQQCQGTAVARWVATGPKGELGRGSNVYDFAPDGRIRRVVGLWEK